MLVGGGRGDVDGEGGGDMSSEYECSSVIYKRAHTSGHIIHWNNILYTTYRVHFK